jgi:hypothetical protein
LPTSPTKTKELLLQEPPACCAPAKAITKDCPSCIRHSTQSLWFAKFKLKIAEQLLSGKA